jgi:hypothetical protein
MPDLVKRGSVNHFSRLIVSMRFSPQAAGKIVHIGDEVQITNVSKSLFNTIPD